MVHLALGSDLTTLGLNLNSPENLYPKFASPWASAPCRPQDIDFHVPSEYLTNIHIRDKLAAIKLSRYGEDLLFYLYYMNGGDLLQLLAAVELFNRDWRYHKEERVWITRAPGMEPTLKTNAYERGTYYFFDCLNWRKVAKEFHLEYDKLEERPHVPSTFNYNPAQQAFWLALLSPTIQPFWLQNHPLGHVLHAKPNLANQDRGHNVPSPPEKTLILTFKIIFFLYLIFHFYPPHKFYLVCYMWHSLITTCTGSTVNNCPSDWVIHVSTLKMWLFLSREVFSLHFKKN